MKIAIIGTGYIGLTEGLCFADLGHTIYCYDIVEEKINKLNNGIPTLYEEGLEEMLKKNLNKNIFFTSKLDFALKDVDVIFICVNTPENIKDGSVDLTDVIHSTEEISKTINNNKHFVLVIRSTVPVGTNKFIKNNMLKINPNLNFSTVSNPEFSRQGSAIKDFLNPDRIVIGVDDENTKEIMKKVYQPFIEKKFSIFFTTIETAELMKYSSNAFLALKISFINEIADICEKTNANIQEVAQAMGMDKRINPYFLQAGPGIGGSCFPKDSIALVNIGKKLGLEMAINQASYNFNKKRKKDLINRVLNITQYNLTNKTISLLGLTFKANTDDTRYSPAIDLVSELAKKNIYVNTYDPKGIEKFKTMVDKDVLNKVNFFSNPYEAIKDSELLVIITEWQEFKELDYNKVYNLLKQKIILDLRNILDKNKIESIGFKYSCIGK